MGDSIRFEEDLTRLGDGIGGSINKGRSRDAIMTRHSITHGPKILSKNAYKSVYNFVSKICTHVCKKNRKQFKLGNLYAKFIWYIVLRRL